MNTRSRISLAVGAVVATIVLGSCSSATESTTTIPDSTTTTVPSDQPIVFGSGEMPSTMPSGFPLPDEARIGSTLVDHTRGVTEVVVTFPASVTSVTDFFVTNLAAVGYTVDSSSGNDAGWSITFSQGDTTGEVRLLPGGTGLSSGTIILQVPVSG